MWNVLFHRNAFHVALVSHGLHFYRVSASRLKVSLVFNKLHRNCLTFRLDTLDISGGHVKVRSGQKSKRFVDFSTSYDFLKFRLFQRSLNDNLMWPLNGRWMATGPDISLISADPVRCIVFNCLFFFSFNWRYDARSLDRKVDVVPALEEKSFRNSWSDAAGSLEFFSRSLINELTSDRFVRPKSLLRSEVPIHSVRLNGRAFTLVNLLR